MGRRDHDRGAAVVEFALILPILLVLIFGIVEFGRVYNIQTSITAAAREGARVMALNDGTNPTGDAAAAAMSAAKPYVISGITVSVTPTPIAPSAPNICPASNTTNAIVKVTITYPVTLLTGWFGASITLHGTGVMRCNG